MARLIFRKSLRLCAVIFPLTYYFNDKFTTLLILIPFLVFFAVIDILRFIFKQFNARLFNRFGFILKEKERGALFTTTWFLLAVFLSVLFFAKDIAIVAILFLIFGDAASDIIGTKFGRIKIGERTLEGSLAFFSACLLIGIVTNFTYINLKVSVFIAGALTATLTELLPLAVDDNFTIALFSGIIMSFVARLF